MIAYKGLNVEFDFFVRNTDGKPQSLLNKTYTANVLDRSSKTSILTKNLVPQDYDKGQLVLKLDHGETLALTAKSYDLIITYTLSGDTGNFGGSSDLNNRITFVLEIRDGAVPELRPSETVSVFNANGDDRIGGKMTGPALNNSKSGLNTAQVHLTNYTGVYKFQGSISLQPLDGDFFDITGQSYTVSAKTAVEHHTFTGNFTYVRLVHTPDASNAGTLDKVVHRS